MTTTSAADAGKIRASEAPLVHGTFVSVGGMRAARVDRRFVTPVVPAGAVDAAKGLLGRAGVEQAGRNGWLAYISCRA